MDQPTLQDILSSHYEQDQWIELLRAVFHTGNVFHSAQPLTSLPGQLADKGYQLGNFETADGYEIGVFEIHLKGNVAIHRNRVGVRNLLRSYYKQLDGVFAVFKQQDNWRFSFISQLRDWNKEEETWELKETEPKRFTYLLGENEAVKTATERFYQLVEADQVQFDDIKEAFSVEKLNKEFYKKVVSSFYDLLGIKEPGRGGQQHPKLLELPDLPESSENSKKIYQEFAVRLIGRIVFCWFLKFKKSKQGNPIIPQEALSSSSVVDGYYHQKLERLFFQVLNTQKKDRRDDLPEEYHEIPFLNGGLFEPHRYDFYKPGRHTGISQNLNTLKIPDDWFQNLFEILEQYNFTIDENSVEDADVSVDPEMLGRIFENLLAEIDPASGKTARKATGSYYTPREIVDYMVNESLNKYLSNETGIEERRLLPLFKFDSSVEHTITDEEKDQLLRALNRCSVLDPACGSGAFPMGILQKMVRILEKIDPNSVRWKNLQIEKIPDATFRRIVRKRLDEATVEYARKLGIIQHSIYGVDIQPIAAEISKLRCFLSLVVDERVDEAQENWNIEPLPNLEFKFLAADTLKTLPKEKTNQFDMFGSFELQNKLSRIREDYLQAYGENKETLREQFADVQSKIMQKEFENGESRKSERAMALSAWEPFDDSVTRWFDPKWMFGVEQFNVVLGNPPYGGDKIANSLKKEMGLGSKDPYGAFIARFLPDGSTQSPLAHEGLLCLIVSDTFMTIKTHHQLREKMMDNYIHKMIRVHKDTFGATVNTVVILCERNEFPRPADNGQPVPEFDDSHTSLMADLTQISIHKQHERFLQLLEKTVQYEHPLAEPDQEQAEEKDGVLYMSDDHWTIESSEEYAIYTYPQALINRNSNKPFFVASPKLFALIFDDEQVPTTTVTLNGDEITAREITLNNKTVEVVKLGQIADVKVGLQTGDNDSYLFQNPEARGNYRDINDYREYLLTEDDLERIQQDEEIRIDVIENGISKDDPDSDRYFGGRYIVPYDKGGKSNSSGGWLPNYFVQPDYFIDWSEKHASCLVNSELISESSSTPYPRNKATYFKKGITYSRTGDYAPTFRMGTGSVFDDKSCTIFLEDGLSNKSFLGLLTTRLFKFYFKNFQGHTVDAQVDDLKEMPISFSKNILPKLATLVNNIIQKQKKSSFYDYARNEQIKINNLVYYSYGLNKYDIREVENWYARRYSKLVAAQKKNLAKQGKPTDYLELYEMVEEGEEVRGEI